MKTTGTRILSLLLCLAMLLTLLPTVTFAAGDIASGEGWRLDGAGCLHITGSITNSSTTRTDNTPWVGCKGQIRTVVAEPGAKVDSCFKLFMNCPLLESADLRDLDTSAVSNMQAMFSQCASLTDVNLEGCNTAKVTNLSSMFASCSALETIDLSCLDTANVQYTDSMFYDCRSLKALDLSSFDTAKVKMTDGMFQNCTALTSLDISSFSTAALGSKRTMFDGCTGLKELKTNHDLLQHTAGQMLGIFATWYDQRSGEPITTEAALTALTGKVTLVTDDQLAGWYLDDEGCLHLTGKIINHGFNLHANGSEDQTPWVQRKAEILSVVAEAGSSVNNATALFFNCSNLVSADLRKLDMSAAYSMKMIFDSCTSLRDVQLDGIDTSNVCDMEAAFYNCSALKELDLSSLNTAEVYTMDFMFDKCKALTSLDLSSFDTSNVQRMGYIFGECTSLTELDLSHFNTSKLYNWGEMFYYCQNLKSINLSGFDTSSAEWMTGMFCGCSSLTELDLSGFDTSKSDSLARMFEGCSSLTSLDLRSFDTSNVTTMERMFIGCTSLTSLDLSNFDTSNVTKMNAMFQHCTALTSLDLSNFDTAKVDDMIGMFWNCTALTSLDLSSFDTAKVKNTEGMFRYCSSLTTLDISSFDLSAAESCDQMLFDCPSLTELGTNQSVLAKTADQVLALHGRWHNKDTGAVYETEEALKAISGTVTLVPGCSHASTEVKNKKSATCTADGYTGDTFCTLCGELLEAGTVIPARGHNWNEWVSISDTQHQRTCKRNANHTETADHTVENGICTVCGKVFNVTLTFESNGGSAIEALTAPAGTVVDLSRIAPHKDKYLFTGWYLDEELTQPVTSLTLTADTTIYAGWKADLPFTDVKEGAWYYPAVVWAYTNGVVDGTTATTFSPLRKANRATLVTILWRMAGSPKVDIENPFTDVKVSNWYYEPIMWAAATGVVGGKTPDTFAPQELVTREQTAVILYRYTKLLGVEPTGEADLSIFPDGDHVTNYAKTAMRWAVANHLINGNKINGVDMLDARGTTNRAQICVILRNFDTLLNG